MFMVLFVAIMTSAQAQIVEVQLDGENLCDGRLQVDIYLKASNFSTSNFSLASSSILLDYDTSVVQFDEYIPVSFDSTADAVAAGALWIDQAVSYDDQCGKLHIVAHKNDGGTANYVINKQEAVLMGTAIWTFKDEELDPEISLHDGLTLFNNALTNDGTATVTILDFPKVLDYSCVDQCVLAPSVTEIISHPEECGLSSGSLTMFFDDIPGETELEFSIDGGVNFSYAALDNADSLVIENLPSGFYSCWVRWGDDRCPSFVEDIDIGVIDAPVADVAVVNSCGSLDDGIISLHLGADTTRDTVLISLDGGINFTNYGLQDQVWMSDGLAPGSYDLWIKWQGEPCPVDLGYASVFADDLPSATYVKMNPCDTNDLGSLSIELMEGLDHDTAEISLDGGLTWAYELTTESSVIDDMATGSYDLWLRWSDDRCPVYLATVTIEQEAPPEIDLVAGHICNSEGTAELVVQITDDPLRDSVILDFETDQVIVADDIGSYTIQDLPAGEISVTATWSDSECLMTQSETIIDYIVPAVTVNTQAPTCELDNGSLELSIATSSEDSVLVSIDGGLNFELVPTGQSTIYMDLAAGNYAVEAKLNQAIDCPVSIDVYELIPESGSPTVSVDLYAAACGEDDGVIKFYFDDSPDQTAIQLSIDGGSSYVQVADTTGVYQFSDLAAGSYILSTRWADSSCTVDLGSYDIDALSAPSVSYQAFNSECILNDINSMDLSNGYIILAFDDSPLQDYIEFSIDGGLSFPYSTLSFQETYTISGLTPGEYTLAARWGDGLCELSLGSADIGIDGGPEVTWQAYPDCSSQANGMISLQFDDEPMRYGLEFSLDGGVTFPYVTSDVPMAYVIDSLAAGLYDLWVRYDDQSCPMMVSSVEILGTSQLDLSISVSPSNCELEDGLIQLMVTDDPERDSFHLSLDGGVTYPFIFSDSDALVSITDLPAGEYHLSSMWPGDECIQDHGLIVIDNIDAPQASVELFMEMCDAMDGQIDFTITDDPERTMISLSIDGGMSWTEVADDIGVFSFTDLESGFYDLAVRWPNGDCLVELGEVEVEDVMSPDILATATNAFCTADLFDMDRWDLSNGEIQLDFTGIASEDMIEISIDGGLSYPYSVSDEAGQYVIDDLVPGVYKIWARWGSGTCADYVDQAVIEVDDGPEMAFAKMDACLGQNLGGITFYPENHPNHAYIEISLDGGITYPYMIPDLADSFHIDDIEEGAYDIWIRFMDNSCPVHVDVIYIDEVDCGPPLTCYDGVLNGDEEYIDCGGLCDPCNACPFDDAVIDVSQVLSVSLDISASSTIQAINVMLDSTILSLQAVESVELTAGFEVPLGAEFEAKIDECN